MISLIQYQNDPHFFTRYELQLQIKC